MDATVFHNNVESLYQRVLSFKQNVESFIDTLNLDDSMPTNSFDETLNDSVSANSIVDNINTDTLTQNVSQSQNNAANIASTIDVDNLLNGVQEPQTVQPIDTQSVQHTDTQQSSADELVNNIDIDALLNNTDLTF